MDQLQYLEIKIPKTMKKKLKKILPLFDFIKFPYSRPEVSLTLYLFLPNLE